MLSRSRLRRAAAAVAAVGLALLTSGCVSLLVGGPDGQTDVIGDESVSFVGCASGSSGCGNGFSNAAAVNGSGQLLVGVLVPPNARLQVPFFSSVQFFESPSYASELQRLLPPPQGATWRGFISIPLTYDTAGSLQSYLVGLKFSLLQGAEGSPYAGPFQETYVVGGRQVSANAPLERAVSCGPDPRALYVEPASSALIICDDNEGSTIEAQPNDLGILTGASATVAQGGLAVMPFTMKFAGDASPQARFRLSASSTLPGALFAVTPATLVPASNSTTVAQVAIGVPAGTRPGSYDVTLTAVLGGQVRTSAGTLRVLPAPATTGGGGTTATKLTLTTVLPRRLSAAVARRKGIEVLVGATSPGSARAQLFQGRGTVAKAAKRVRLRVPGPVRIVLRSRKLVKGPYRVMIRADGRTFTRRAVLAR